jgi:hypothetical protein
VSADAGWEPLARIITAKDRKTIRLLILFTFVFLPVGSVESNANFRIKIYFTISEFF